MSATLDRLESREVWLAERRRGVGASEVAAILGVDPRRGPLAVYASKVAPPAEDDDEPEDSPLYWGRRFEEPVAAWYAEATKRTVTNPGEFSLHRHAAAPLFATLDRNVADPTRVETPGVLECKAVSVWGPMDLWRVEAPLLYQVQLQAQLAVTGREWGSVAALLGGTRPVYHDYARNDRFIDAMLLAVQQFWKCVERREPPPPDITPSVRDALHRLWPEDSGVEIAMPEDKVGLVAEWEHAKEAHKATEARKDEMEAQIKAVLQDATWARLPDGRRVQWKTEPRRGHVVEPSKPRVLRLVKK